MAPIDRHAADHMDARITIEAPDNTRGAAEVARRAARADEDRQRRRSSAGRWRTRSRGSAACSRRTRSPRRPACRSTTYEDFVYGACLRDWDAEAQAHAPLLAPVRRGRRGADRRRRDRPERSRSRAGRASVDDGHVNMPGGEFFFSPLEDSAEGTILPRRTRRSSTARRCRASASTFRKGRVEEASAEQGEDVLLAALDIDEGARFVGELGIGCNPAITRPMRNILYRREDGRDRPPRGRRRATRRSAARTAATCTGTWSRTCGGAAGSSSTARPSRRTEPG